MHTDPYPTGLRWAYDGVGKRAAEACAAAGAHESASSAHHISCSAIRASTAPEWTQLCAVAQVSKRTAYQHFASKDGLVAEYLRRFDPDVMPGVFDRSDLTLSGTTYRRL